MARKPPDPPTLFLDENLDSDTIAEALSNAGERRLRLRHRRRQQGRVADAVAAAEARQLEAAELDDVVDREEVGGHSASFRKVASWRSMRRAADARRRARRSASGSGSCDAGGGDGGGSAGGLGTAARS